jgi:diketogulonate reductase-like aldo/keto reductase
MEKLQEAGKAKSIGVSNYLRPHLEATLKTAKVVPAVNQIEFHPYLQRANDYVPWMKSKGIRVEALKPMVPVTLAKSGPLDGNLAEIAQNHNVPVDSVLLRWQMQQGVVPITISRHAARLDEYGAATTFEVTNGEMETVTSIGLTHHYRAWGMDRFAPDDRT